MHVPAPLTSDLAGEFVVQVVDLSVEVLSDDLLLLLRRSRGEGVEEVVEHRVAGAALLGLGGRRLLDGRLAGSCHRGGWVADLR